MKKSVLLAALLSVYYFVATAQNVLVKDSSVSSLDGINYTTLQVSHYLYNNNCLVSVITSGNTQQVHTYNADKTLYQLVVQSTGNPAAIFSRTTYTYTAAKQKATEYYETSDGLQLVPSELITNTYNAANKITQTVTQEWDATTKKLVNYSQEIYTYDANGAIVKDVEQDWDATTSTWTANYETNYYNNNKLLPDSAYGLSFVDETSTKGIFIFKGNVLFQETLYDSTSHEFDGAERLTLYTDSANYIRKDSTVYEDLTPPSTVFTVSYTSVDRSIYNTDGTLKEENHNTTAGTQKLYSKTFYTYGPCSSVLPVTFISFTGGLQNKNAVLSWQTGNETNTSHFTIGRSTNGKDFAGIGTIAASGNSAAYNNYMYTDANAFAAGSPKIYYRLAESDKSGTVTYSKTIELTLTGNGIRIIVSPNPVGNTITLYSPETITNAVITIADMRGKTMYSAKQNINAGVAKTIDASAFAKGMYIVTIQSASNRQQLKIIK